jgi:magnesium transporter
MNIQFDNLDKILKPMLLETSISELATLFEENESQRYRIFLLVGVKKFAEVFIFLDEELQVGFFNTLKKNEQQQLLNFLSVNDVKSFFDNYDEKERIELLKLLERKNAQAVVRLFSYDEDSAAAVSSSQYISFINTISVKEATYSTITNSQENDEIDVIFFHDANKKYVGATTIKDLISADALKKIRDYDILMLPVLTREHEMIGFISETDALNLMAETHEYLIRSMVKVAEDDDNLSATHTAITRFPWLLISVILNLLIASVFSNFSGLLAAFVGLVLFQPMILGMAGNIGTQSMGVTILSLHENDIKIRRHFGRETLIAFINSALSGIAGFGVVYLFLLIIGEKDPILYAAIVGMSLMIAMLISAVAAVLTPIVLRLFKMDEKAASGPLISTINDFFALGSYYLVAYIITTLIK